MPAAVHTEATHPRVPAVGRVGEVALAAAELAVAVWPILGWLEAKALGRRDGLAVDGLDGAIGRVGNSTEVGGEVDGALVETPAHVENYETEGGENVLGFEAQTEETELEDKVVGEESFEALNP